MTPFARTERSICPLSLQRGEIQARAPSQDRRILADERDNSYLSTRLGVPHRRPAPTPIGCVKRSETAAQAHSGCGSSVQSLRSSRGIDQGKPPKRYVDPDKLSGSTCSRVAGAACRGLDSGADRLPGQRPPGRAAWLVQRPDVVAIDEVYPGSAKALDMCFPGWLSRMGRVHPSGRLGQHDPYLNQSPFHIR